MNDPQEKITKIIDWTIENPDYNFNASFIYSCQEALDEFGKLTERQEQALDNIIKTWIIE